MTPTLIIKSSSNISRLDYDEETRTLIVTFKNSGIYSHDDVPPEKFAEAAKINEDGNSIGRWYQANIRGRYTSTRMPTPTETREPINTLAAG